MINKKVEEEVKKMLQAGTPKVTVEKSLLKMKK